MHLGVKKSLKKPTTHCTSALISACNFDQVGLHISI